MKTRAEQDMDVELSADGPCPGIGQTRNSATRDYDGIQVRHSDWVCRNLNSALGGCRTFVCLLGYCRTAFLKRRSC